MGVKRGQGFHACTGFYAALGANATVAFFANLCNFAITKHTSALTLQVNVTHGSCP